MIIKFSIMAYQELMGRFEPKLFNPPVPDVETGEGKFYGNSSGLTKRF
jgi:hypothetical protein